MPRQEVSLTPEEMLELVTIAEDQGVSRSEVMRYGMQMIFKMHAKGTLAILPAQFVKTDARYTKRIRGRYLL